MPNQQIINTAANALTNSLVNPEREKIRMIERKKIECINRGGEWDEATQTCIIKPKTDTSTTETKETTQSQGGETTNPLLERARTQGVPVQAFQQEGESRKAFIARSGLPIAEQESIINRNAQIAQQQLQAVNQDFGALLPLEASQQSIADVNPFNVATTVGAGVAGAIGGAKFGASVGSLVGPAGTIAGGIIGGAGGAIGGAIVKLSAEERQNVKKADRLWRTSKTNRDIILNKINSGALTEGGARALWAEQKANIALAHSFLKSETQNSLKDFLGSPGDELINLEAYLALESAYDLEFERALLSPNIRNIVSISQEPDVQVQN
jgi:outer membrane lipoprotein SlyB